MVVQCYGNGFAVWHAPKTVEPDKRAMVLQWYCSLACGSESGARQESDCIAMVWQWYGTGMAVVWQWYCSLACVEESGARQESDGMTMV